jgi:hypothetical protein
MALVFLLPVAELHYSNNQLVIFRVTGFWDQAAGNLILPAIPVVILAAVVVCINIIIIFLFKRRVIQARLCIVNIVLLTGLIGLYIYHFVFVIRKIPVVEYKAGLSFVFPVIAIILTYLAFRGIRKDELLVRLADRLR